MVEFRVLNFKMSNEGREGLIQALRSCKELEARILKRLNVLNTEFLVEGEDGVLIPASELLSPSELDKLK